jgi:hypothetical protein
MSVDIIGLHAPRTRPAPVPAPAPGTPPPTHSPRRPLGPLGVLTWELQDADAAPPPCVGALLAGR